MGNLAELVGKAKAASIPFRKAAIILAVSKNETGYGLLTSRRGVSSSYSTECWPNRQILRLERGRSESSPLPSVVTSDTVLMGWLKTHGYLNSNSSGKYWFTSEVSAVDSELTPNDTLAKVFEAVLDNRSLKALRLFSIGMTQIFLHYSPIAATGSVISGRFDTIDELFKFYTAANLQVAFSGSWFDYLPTTAVNYPTPSSTSDNCKAFLESHQTGVGYCTDAYLSGFIAAVKAVWTEARSISYPNIS